MLDDIKQDYEFPTEMVELEALNTTGQIGKDNYKVKGVASSQRLFQNCNHLLYNLQQNIFPKTTAT